MIYLNCEVKSGLGEDTFWTWFEREFPGSSFDIPKKLNDEDILLRYSTLGFLPIDGKQVAICWELYPEMKQFFNTSYFDDRIKKVENTARYATYRTVATASSVKNYEKFGQTVVIPIGVNTDLYKPLKNKKQLREKYKLPTNKKIGVWISTYHPMKGLSKMLEYADNHPDIEWIIIWKWNMEELKIKGVHNFVKIKQNQINELFNAADFFLSTSQLAPYFMSEWEAMAANMKFEYFGNADREFYPPVNSRDAVFEMGWDRKSVKDKWIEFFKEKGIKW